MKYAVVGAGAMGSLVGSYLYAAGQEVWLISTFEDHIKAIKEKGLEVDIDGTRRNFGINAELNAIPLGKVDFAILTVKGPSTISAIETLKSLSDENTVILTLQNGYGNVDLLKEHFKAEQIAYGCMKLGGHLLEPGYVIGKGKTGETGIYFGSECEILSEKLTNLASHLRDGGIDSQYMKDIDQIVWQKIAINCANNACCAITRLPLDLWLKNQSAVDLSFEIIKEVHQVARAKGIILAEVKKEKVEKSSLSIKKGKEEGHFTSTLQDILANKTTENDFINGSIVKQGRKYDISTPYNDAVYKLLRVIEETYEYHI